MIQIGHGGGGRVVDDSSEIVVAWCLIGSGFETAASEDRRQTTRSIGRRSKSKKARFWPATAGVEQKLVVERDGVRATFSRDARGR